MPAQGNPNHPPITSELGTYGVLENGTVEWVTDEGYSDSLTGRVRAAVDFLDMHPELEVLVDTTGAATDYPTRAVGRTIGRDGLAGRYTCADYGDNLVKIGVR